MKKLLKIIGLLVVVLITAIVCVALFWLGPVVKKAVETVGPQATGVPVTVEKVHIRPLRGLVYIKGLFVGNPEGFSNPSAVEMKEFKVAVSLGSLMSDTIIVKEIIIDAPQFTYERTLKTDNIKEIQKNVEAFSGAADKPAKEPKPEEPVKEPKEKKPAKKVIIEHLLIRDGKVLAKVIGLPTAPIPLTTIEKFDIGKDDGGTSYGQASVEIISAIYDSIYKAVAGLAGGATDLIKGAGDMSTEDMTEVGTKAIKSIGGMFKKKE